VCSLVGSVLFTSAFREMSNDYQLTEDSKQHFAKGSSIVVWSLQSIDSREPMCTHKTQQPLQAIRSLDFLLIVWDPIASSQKTQLGPTQCTHKTQ